MKNPYIKQLTRRLRGRWSARTLGEHGVAILAETKNGRLAVPAGDFNVSRALLQNGEYDWPQITWLKPLFDENSRVVFAGAHIGAVLIPLVTAAATRCVVAYEPSPRNFKLLTVNLELNGARSVAAINAALGETAGDIQFTEDAINTGNSRVASSGGEITVKLTTLDATLAEDWSCIDLIVMDIEGSEVAAMRGAPATLAKTRNFYVEFAPEQLREQGSSAAEFAETVDKYFKSAYVFGAPILFLGPGKFAEYLKGLQHSRSLLLNILFTQDLEANPERMMNSREKDMNSMDQKDHKHDDSHDHGQAGDHAHHHDRTDAHDGADGHSHSHAIPAEGVNLRMGIAVALNLVFVLVEGGFGFLSNSVALIADAGHNLSDVLGLVCAWGALILSRRPPGAKFTYGLGRSSVLAALANAVLLLLACGAIAWEAASRLGSPPPVMGKTVMLVAAIGIAINGISAWMLHAGSHGDLNRRSAYLHMLSDAVVSAGVVVSGLLITVTGWTMLDPIVSLVIVAVILVSTWRLLRDSLTLSLDGVPSNVNSSAVMSYLARQRGVTDVHDLHIWALSTTSVALTAHLVVPDRGAEDSLLAKLTPDLKRRFQIQHATLQIERDRCAHGCEDEAVA